MNRRVTIPVDTELLDTPFSIEFGPPQTFCTFPWSSNGLNNAVLQVRFGDNRLRLQLPSELTLDPRIAFASSTVTAASAGPERVESPSLPRVDWLSLHYECGWFQNRWHLSLVVSNQVETTVDMILYRDRGQWELESPKTTLAIHDGRGAALPGRLFAQSRPDPVRRVDRFAFGPISTASSPGWGTVVLLAGEDRYALHVPRGVYSHGP